MAVRNCSQRCSPPAQAPAPARRVRGAARARVARVSGARAGVPAAARAFGRTVQYRGEASMPNGTKSRERRRSFSRYGTSTGTRSACTGTDRIYVASTSRQVEFTSHLQVLSVAFTPKIYVAHATRCELSSKVTVCSQTDCPVDTHWAFGAVILISSVERVFVALQRPGLMIIYRFDR